MSTAIVQYDGTNLMEVVRSRGTRATMEVNEFTIPYVEAEQEELRYCAFHKRMEPASSFARKQLFNAYNKRYCLEWSHRTIERSAVVLEDEPWFSGQDVVRMQNILHVTVPGYTQVDILAQRKETAAEAANDARNARLEARRLDGDTLEFDGDGDVDIVGEGEGACNDEPAAPAGSKRKQPVRTRGGTRQKKDAKKAAKAAKEKGSSSRDRPDQPLPVRDDQLAHWLAGNLKFMPAFKDGAAQRELKGEMAERDAFNQLSWLVALDEVRALDMLTCLS